MSRMLDRIRMVQRGADKDPLDAGRMGEAAKRLEGMHDFRSFAEDDPRKSSTRVLVDRVELLEEGDLILVRLRASHLVRPGKGGKPRGTKHPIAWKPGEKTLSDLLLEDRE